MMTITIRVMPRAIAVARCERTLRDRVRFTSLSKCRPSESGNHRFWNMGLELVDQPADILVRHDGVLVAVNDQAGGWTGREKRKIVEVGGWGNRDEPLDLGPAHEQLHPDPGTEGESGNPAAPGLGIDRLRPVER